MPLHQDFHAAPDGTVGLVKRPTRQTRWQNEWHEAGLRGKAAVREEGPFLYRWKPPDLSGGVARCFLASDEYSRAHSYVL